MGMIKRRFEVLLNINQMVVTSARAAGRPPLTFYDDELLGGAPNFAIPLLV